MEVMAALMKRQFFGIALFVSIIASGAVLSGILNETPALESPTESLRQIPRIPTFQSPASVSSRVDSRLIAIFYDEAKKKMIATVELEWNGEKPKPKKVEVEISKVARRSPLVKNSLHIVTFKQPFLESSVVEHEIVWDDRAFLDVTPKSDRNAFIQATTGEALKELEDSGGIELVIVEKNYLVDSVPILLKPEVWKLEASRDDLK